MRPFRALEKASAARTGATETIASGSTSSAPSRARSARTSAGGVRSRIAEARSSSSTGTAPGRLGLALDRDGDLGHHVAGEANRDLELAEVSDRLLQLDAATIDRLTDALGERARDVGRGDGAVETVL